ncbi:MAG: hypothetical protein MJ193_00470, partial [Clostridia bacterium]|nr:hypothetical protein [Clostridia bacterium]
GYNDGVVKDLTLTITLNATMPAGSSITKSNIGAVASYNTGDIIDVFANISGSVNLQDITFGGIVANNAGGELTNVTSHISFNAFEGLKVIFGGIVGNTTSGPIKNATVILSVKYSTAEVLNASSLYAGGVAGQTTGGTISKANIKSFDVNFNATTSAYIGGVAGTTQGVKIDQALIKTATINGSASVAYAGAVVGSNGGTVSNCEIEDINIDINATSIAYAGGMVGGNSNSTGTAKVVYSVLIGGDIVVSTESGKVYAGAIAGLAENSTLSYSYSAATVSAYAPATNELIGNIVGKYSSTASFTNIFFGNSTVLKLNDEEYQVIDDTPNFPVCKTAKETLATDDNITTATWIKANLGLNPDSEEIWTITDGTTPKLAAFVA